MKKIILFLIVFLATWAATGQQASLSGTILRPDGTALVGITVKLLDAQGQLVGATGVGGGGSYQFANLPAGQEYTVVPELQGQPLLDVSTLDMVLGARHILGLQLLDSPLKVLAADANLSNSLTTFDLVLIRQLILGMAGEFPVDWRFVRTTTQFQNPENPWMGVTGDSPSVLLEGDVSGFNFFALKIGDLSW
ncbi:MAG: hypothetical protein KDD19_02285 [Phaeodactylibacter sp.]|nr:hypothetical protein [Phaeodactylibacter sp.]MCB9048981.1 hypothetical protein [Lewinellaceae bacterium]